MYLLFLEFCSLEMKIVLLGENFIGKSSFAYRFVNRKFNSCSMATIGVEFFTKMVPKENNRHKRRHKIKIMFLEFRSSHLLSFAV